MSRNKNDTNEQEEKKRTEPNEEKKSFLNIILSSPSNTLIWNTHKQTVRDKNTVQKRQLMTV